MAAVRDISSEADYKETLSSLGSGVLVTIFFHTPWAAPCEKMRTFFDTLASQYTGSAKAAFLAIDAEALPDISEAFDVTAVPFFVLTRDGVTIESISGSNSGKVRDAVEKETGSGANGAAGAQRLPEKLQVTPGVGGAGDSTKAKDLSGYTPAAGDPKTGPEYSGGQIENATSQEDLNKRLADLVKAAPVMLFMKGTPSSPQCGFSRQIVAILRERGVRYGFFNILADEEVRQGMKTFADWPTFPQLWVGGELVGGLDIVKDELESNPDFFAEYSVSKQNGASVTPGQQQNVPQVAAA